MEQISNEFLLEDRLQKIKQIIDNYGEDKFSISFSGGKDSTVLSALIDMALPNNSIPRVYADTGIELNMIRDFVYEMKNYDNRITIIRPQRSIKTILEENGYPFKSKQHAKWVDMFQRNGKTQSVENYLASPRKNKKLYRTCPKILQYQFDETFNIRISDKCCLYLKEKNLDEWRKNNQRPYAITGIMRAEGGRRMGAQCLAFRGNKLKSFQPLAPMSKDWERWFIDTFHINVCKIYKPPYNFIRTGCKGCPFALHLQKELDMLEKYFPAEKKQCEYIWQPIYEEYRRLGYRLRPNDTIPGQITLDDWVKEHEN